VKAFAIGPFRRNFLRQSADTNVSWGGIVRQSTKKATLIRRFGASVIGIVTGANRQDPAAWTALSDCEIAEFRADTFLSPSGIPDTRRLADEFLSFRSERDRRGLTFRTLVTLRLRRDGGAWPDSQSGRRAEIWEVLGCAGKDPAPDWMDIEIEEYPGLPESLRNGFTSSGIRVLLSHHDFAGCPPRDRLSALLRQMSAARPAGVKFAVTCATRSEALALMDFAREAAAASPWACVLSMGEAGRALRVLGPVLGCPLAYGYLTGSAVAPGQLSATALGRRLDRFSGDLPAGLLVPGAEARLLDWAEARLQGETLD
jgi:3-dehydroquinate dehydratase type I